MHTINMENKRNKKYKVVAIIAMVLSIISLSTAYASLTSNLNIKGKTVKKSAEEVVVWKNIQSISQTGYAQAGNLTISDDGKTVYGYFGTVIAPGDKLIAKWSLVNDDAESDQDITITNLNIECRPASINGSTVEEASEVCNHLTSVLMIDGWGSITNKTNLYTMKKGEIRNVVLTLDYDHNFDKKISGLVSVSINDINVQ